MSKKSAQTAAGALFLFCLNAYVCRELFVTEFTQHMGSIESTFIALARYVMEHPWGLTWFPWWYGGIPYQNTYQPLLHLSVAAVASVAGISAPLSYHAVTAATYCLGPVTLFWMGSRLSGRLLPSLAAAVLYSVVSPSAFLAPSVATDMGTFLGPRRLQALVNYGEGPHITSMFLLPLAIIALAVALRRARPISTLVAAVATMSVVLTNWIGTVALAMAVAAYLLAKGEAGSIRKWAHAAGIGGLSYALAATWIPPSTLFAVQRNAQIVVGRYEIGVKQWLYLVLVLLVVLAVRYSLRRALVSEFAQFWGCFFVLCGSLPLTAEWLDIYILPQPERYHLEMEMAVCFLAAIVLGKVFEAWRVHGKLIATVAVLLVGAYQLQQYRSYAQTLVGRIDVTGTVEYQVARWLDENLTGQRVFLPGSMRFWLNVFADNPQLGGGADQAMTNPQLAVTSYGITTTRGNGEDTALWLKAYGVRAIAVGGPQSREVYKDFHDPTKFEGVLPDLWRDGDDVIYGVPSRTESLVHVIRYEDLMVRAPTGFSDVAPLVPFVAALENPDLPLAKSVWPSPHEARIVAELRREHLIATQVSYHPGWRAWVNGEPRRIFRDELGLMTVETKCEGRCVVELHYDGGAEMWLARFLSAAAVLGILVWLGADWRSRRFRKVSQP